MILKMQPRTPGLCVTCSNGQVTEDVNGHVITFCNNLMKPFIVRWPVKVCTDYEDRRYENEHNMRQIAWIIKTDAKGKLGFQPPKKDD